jgi:hypothetical protein
MTSSTKRKFPSRKRINQLMMREQQLERYKKIGYHLTEFLRLGNRFGDFDKLKEWINKPKELETQRGNC